MQYFILSLQQAISSFQYNFSFVLGIIGLLFLIHLINWALDYKLNFLGIYPRTIIGLPGIIFTPFLHGNFNHLFFNSIPLFILINLILLKGRMVFYTITLVIILISGFAIWLLGRRAIHVGASSLIMGYFGYLFTDAYYHPTAMTIIIAMVCIYYFGGLIIASTIPSGKKNISWEGHLFGLAAGIIAAMFF